MRCAIIWSVSICIVFVYICNRTWLECICRSWHYQFRNFIIKQALQNAILHMFGASGVLPRVLPFTQFYPGFTQLPSVKLGKTVQRFYPPTLRIMNNYTAHIPIMFTATLKLSQSASRHLDTAYLQTTATPTGMRSESRSGHEILARDWSARIMYIVAWQTYRQTEYNTSLPLAGEVKIRNSWPLKYCIYYESKNFSEIRKQYYKQWHYYILCFTQSNNRVLIWLSCCVAELYKYW